VPQVTPPRTLFLAAIVSTVAALGGVSATTSVASASTSSVFEAAGEHAGSTDRVLVAAESSLNRKPRVRALKSTGTAGKNVRLRYKTWDDGGRTRERIRVFRGKRRIAQLRSTLSESRPGRTYYLNWRVPRSLSGFYRFCVMAWDAQARKSKPSCGRLDIAQPASNGGAATKPPPNSTGGGTTSPPAESTARTYRGVGLDHKFLRRDRALGKIITVWDQFFRKTVWRVDRIDRWKTILWLPLHEIVVQNHDFLFRKYTLTNIAQGDVTWSDVVTAEFLGYD